MPKRILKYTEALKEATDQMMAKDESVVVFGLGVTYKNGADGTTAGLKEKYPHQVFDMPVSENAITGMGVGAAISGLKPIVHHGRVEFSLFAMDQIATQASKWNYMFGGKNPVSAVFRIAVGRQWGNGPQHTQALYGLFGSITGLKVVIPSSPRMAKGLLVSAVRDKNPVVMLEPRWLYNVKENVPEKEYALPLGKAHIVQKGKNVTVVTYGDGVVAAQEALKSLPESMSVELIDLVSLNPIDYDTIRASVQKTGRLITVDTTSGAFSVGREVIGTLASSTRFKRPPVSLACPDVPCPTSPALTAKYYPTKVDIENAIRNTLGKPSVKRSLSFDELHLAPTLTLP